MSDQARASSPPPAEMPDSGQSALIAGAVEVLSRDDRVLGVWLTGSYGRGTQDRFSDVDLWVVVEAGKVGEFCGDWPAVSDRIAPIVLRKQVPGSRVFSQVTSDWVRFDLSIGTPEDLPRRTASTVRPLHDPHDLSARLAAPGPELGPRPERVEALTEEFLRVLGLLPVVVGREEYVIAELGSGLALQLLTDLLREDVAIEDRGGALTLNRLLPPDRRQSLLELPPIAANRESVINFHRACADLFLPLARDLYERCGLDWPTELEDALRRRLGATLKISLADDHHR